MMCGFISFYCGVYLCVDDSNRQNIFDTTNQIMIVNILQNWSHKYSYQYGIIYCIVFEPIHYAINSYVVYP